MFRDSITDENRSGRQLAIDPRAVREALRHHDRRPDVRRERRRRIERVLQAERRRNLPLRIH